MKSQQPAMQRIPPETTEKRRLVSDASAPASRFPTAGALATWASSIPDRRPAHRVRGHGEQDRRAEDRAPVVRAAGDREEEEREPEAGREAEADDRGPPGRRRDAHAEALPAGACHPAGQERGDERACVRGGVQKADGRRSAAEVVAERREERARHPEHHRDRVDDEDALELRLLADEAETLGDRPQSRPRDRPDRGHLREQRRRQERCREGDDVDRVRRRQSDRRDQDPAHRRSSDMAEGRVDPLDGRCWSDLVLADEARDERVHRGALDRVESGADRFRRVQGPEPRIGERGIRDQQAGDRGEAQVGDDQEQPTIDGVGDRAAEEGDRQQRDERGDAEEPDREGRAGQLVDLVRDRDRRQHASEERNGVAEPEPAKCLRAPKGRQVDREAAQDGEPAGTFGFAGEIVDRRAKRIGQARRVSLRRPGSRSSRAGGARGG